MSRLYEASWLNLPRAPLQRAGWIELYASHCRLCSRTKRPGRLHPRSLFIFSFWPLFRHGSAGATTVGSARPSEDSKLVFRGVADCIYEPGATRRCRLYSFFFG
jgi:hypothetical protein